MPGRLGPAFIRLYRARIEPDSSNASGGRVIGATLIVATTHPDLRAELGATVAVPKHYRERLKVERADAVSKRF